MKNHDKTEVRKAEVAQAALELFFEKGYEETSIRAIQNKVGKRVSVFYYYFESKYDVFEAALELFFKSYEEHMQKIVDEGRKNPERELTKYLDYMDEATQEFRAQYLKKLNCSILCTIREHTIALMRKYIREILNNYLEKGIIQKPEVDLEVASNMLAFSFGGSILYQSKESYHAQKDELKKLIPLLLGITE